MSVGRFGGAFDPPQRGHVELVRRAKEELGLSGVVVVVSVRPGHKSVDTPAKVRLELARAAFPDETVVLDSHARTIDLLREHPEWDDAWFVIGADEFADFLTWKEPDEVLRHVRLAVGTRPGFPAERLDGVLNGLAQPERVRLFDMEPVPAASRDLRHHLVEADLPPAVAEIIRREGLYPAQPGVH
ncbi:MAG: nicotinate-nicotinamide nucleotide adenylyltransferase [Gaiellaceae bacterium]